MPDFGRWNANGGDPSLNDINRTDRFLDAIAFEQPVYATDPGEAELAHLLAGWRDEVRDAPLTTPITPRDAVVAFEGARVARKHGRTLAIVGSAAAAVLFLGGFVSVVAGSGPGDPLYGLRTMFFGEQQTTRDDAVMLASQQLAEVQQLIDQGQWEAAQEKLQTLTTTVATVNDVEQKQDLVSQWQQLTVKVEQQDANAVPEPGAPLPQMPDVPVVVEPGSDTSTSASSETTSTSGSETTSTSGSATSSSESPTTTTSTTPTSETSETTETSKTSAPGTSSSTTSSSSPPVQQLPATSATTSVAAPPQTRVQSVAPTSVPAAPSSIASTALPSPSVPLPTPSARVVLPTPSVVEQAPEQSASAQSPTVEAPKSAVTTTVVVPESGDEPN